MPLATETLVVIIGHSLTAVISMALLVLVLWQAPRLRSNQLFAGMMLLLVAHSLLNIAGRFLQSLELAPWPLYMLIMTLYMGVVVLAMFFTAAFAELHGKLVWRIKFAALTLSAIALASLYSGLVLTDIYPMPNGGFNGTAGPLYIPLGLGVLAYMSITTVLLARSANPKARRLWPAMALILAGYISLTLRPVIPLPLNAILLASAALWMGYVVLQYQIFNPLAELNHELARANAKLAEANSLKNLFMANMS
ncbi:MAG: hypothetical protein JXN59_18180, partial [Anaerolineae bacterium]|nr:hypothetical protein [Anaerolineae bacterium]